LGAWVGTLWISGLLRRQRRHWTNKPRRSKLRTNTFCDTFLSTQFGIPTGQHAAFCAGGWLPLPGRIWVPLRPRRRGSLLPRSQHHAPVATWNHPPDGTPSSSRSPSLLSTSTPLWALRYATPASEPKPVCLDRRCDTHMAANAVSRRLPTQRPTRRSRAYRPSTRNSSIHLLFPSTTLCRQPPLSGRQTADQPSTWSAPSRRETTTR